MRPPLPDWAYVFAVTALLIVFAGLAGFVLNVLYFAVLPEWAVRTFGRTHPERLRRILELVAATPSPIGPAQKLMARGALVDYCLPRSRHAEAAAHCRANLESLAAARHMVDVPALEADIRRRLADCLEALGHAEEAEEERRRAEACVDRAPDDPLRFIAQGTLLEREHRHDEAREAFERALELTPESNRTVRIDCLVHLVLACYHAGRPAETLRRAEDVIALGAEAKFLRIAHRMAALACGNLNRLEEAEGHDRRAYDVAAAEGDAGEKAEILGSLAGIQVKRGKLVEAEAACREALAVAPKQAKLAVVIQGQIQSIRGQFDEALASLRRRGEAAALVIPALERRLQAARVLDMSRIEAEGGRADDAWAHIQEAVAVLGNDAKLGLQCDSVASWVFAARGLADESRRAAEQAEAGLADFEQDPHTCRNILYDLGMAACARGDYDDGEDCWSRYLDRDPYPVYRPSALYLRAECRLHLGDRPGAIADLREAVAMEIDSHHARLASRRLSESMLW